MSTTTSSMSPGSTAYLANAISAAGHLLHTPWYNTTSGLWDTTGWWESGNTVTTLGDLAAIAPDLTPNVTSIYTTTFHNAQATFPGFINDFYDDEAWWALAWIQAYDITNNTGYLTQAASIFQDLTTGWGTSPCGGMWWNKEHQAVNAIANSLFLTVAAKLANRIPSNSTYLDWAQKEWAWFEASGMINEKSNINDGLNLTTCTNNNETVWSYNQGVILGGLIELNQAAPNSSYLAIASNIAKAAISYLAAPNAGILKDVCDPTCDITGAQFKGVFMRNLQALQQTQPEDTFKSFIELQAQSIWSNDRLASNDTLGDAWAGPFTDASATSQSSALDALVAAAAVAGSGGSDNGTYGGGGATSRSGTAMASSTATSSAGRTASSAASSSRSWRVEWRILCCKGFIYLLLGAQVWAMG